MSTYSATIHGLPTAPIPLVGLASQASQWLAPEHVQRAKELATKLMQPGLQVLSESHRADSRAAAMAFGWIAPAEAELSGDALVTHVYARLLCLELGQALSMTGEFARAAAVLGAVAQALVDHHGLRAAARRAAAAEVVSDPRSGTFEREVFTHWGAAAERLGGAAGARAVFRLAVERGVWTHAAQRPLEHFDRSLRPRPFWDARELPAARALEAAAPRILAELESVLGERDAHFSHYHSRVVSSGQWSDVQLYAGCKADSAHCAMCPATAEVIAAQPALNSVIFGSHFFSRLVPGTHLSAHCGPSNFRLRCHLGLVVPDGVRIRVGDEVREWRQGECLVFDDSFEHEVWHEGGADRIVLICDMWHPSIDIERTIRPMLSPSQLQAVEAAVCGRHLLLEQRTYSTGLSVARPKAIAGPARTD